MNKEMTSHNVRVSFSGMPKSVKSEPVFKDQIEYRRFADKFHDEMASTIRKNEKARIRSEESAKEHYIY